MSYRTGQMPRDVTLLRGLVDRVGRLEHRHTVTVGRWSLREDPATGDLLAVHGETGCIRVLARTDEPCPLTATPLPTAQGEDPMESPTTAEVN